MALVLSGALGLASVAMYLVAMYRTYKETFSYQYAPDPLLELSFWLRLPEWCFLSFGLFGLYALLSGDRLLSRRLALAGASGAVVSSVFWLGLVLYEELAGVAGGAIYAQIPFYVFFVILPSGIVLSGVAALWGRGLGRWRLVVPVVCVLGMPFVSDLLPFILLPEEVTMSMQPTFASQVLIASPRLVAAAGFVLLGLVLFGARKRETRLLAGERRATEDRNLALACRLYAEAWVKGNVETLEGIAAPDCEDHYGSGRGPESLKRAITDLRRAFPDLRFEIEKQTAEGDTVTTRWSASGTDRGGVLWYPPTGKHAAFSGMFVDRFADGRLVEHRGESDTASLLEQLGLPRK